MVLKFGPKEHQIERLNLFLMSPESPPKLAFSLLLNLQDGPVGIHTIDNLVVVHHKHTSKSLIFDIGLQKTLVERAPVAVTTIRLHDRIKEAFSSLNTYHPAWVTFPPNLIADVRLGIFSTIKIDLEGTAEEIQDNMMLLDFIMNRKNSEEFFLKTLRRLLLNKELSIRQSAEIFTRILEEPTVALNNNNKGKFWQNLVFDHAEIDDYE
uniref:RGS domain-containing protein n=1 Tax=Bursaphelenchus xylophilus TaxID=6326 RepID=A0A1I7RWY7_BURXY